MMACLAPSKRQRRIDASNHLDLHKTPPIKANKVLYQQLCATDYVAAGVGHSIHLFNAGHWTRIAMFAEEKPAQTDSIINLFPIVLLPAWYPIHSPPNHEAYFTLLCSSSLCRHLKTSHFLRVLQPIKQQAFRQSNTDRSIHAWL